MTVRSDWFYRSTLALTANTTTNLATVPAGERWIIKHCTVTVTAGTLNIVQLMVNGVRFYSGDAQTNNGFLSLFDCFVVMRAAEVLQARPIATCTCAIYISGARLAV